MKARILLNVYSSHVHPSFILHSSTFIQWNIEGNEGILDFEYTFIHTIFYWIIIHPYFHSSPSFNLCSVDEWRMNEGWTWEVWMNVHSSFIQLNYIYSIEWTIVFYSIVWTSILPFEWMYGWIKILMNVHTSTKHKLNVIHLNYWIILPSNLYFMSCCARH